MTNRYPLVLNTSNGSTRIAELSAGDNLYLKNNDLVDVKNIISEGNFSTRSISIQGIGTVINSSGQWTGETANLIGFTGSQGDIGYTGSQGDIGYTGSQGDIGYTGSQGATGFTGSASNLLITEETTNSIRYVPFVNSTSGTVEDLFINSTKLFYNPFTETLNSTIFIGTNYITVSDERIKEDIETIQNSSNVIDQLNPVKFKWKNNKQTSYGLIAQELEQVLPELVIENNGIKHVSYLPLIAFLIAEIKNLKETINSI